MDVTWAPRSIIAMCDESDIRGCCTMEQGTYRRQLDVEKGLLQEVRSDLRVM